MLTKLIAAYLAPTLALVVLAPCLGYFVARRSLEQEVGKRLVSNASAAAAVINAELLLTLQPGDEQSRTYRHLRTRIEALRQADQAQRIYVVDAQRRLLVGSGLDLPIGSPLPALERDRTEVERALGGNATASSVPFKGIDGRVYQSGYAAVLDGQGKSVALVGVDASAEFFEVLRRLGSSMVLLAVACGSVGLVLFLLIGRLWIVRPMQALLKSVQRIGLGDLSSEVPGVGSDQIAQLAQGMEEMRRQLFHRQREMQMMLAGIAHEVRNPLGGIELFAGLLAEDLANEPEKLAHVRRMQRELGHLKQMVDDFLGWAREPKLSKERLQVGVLLNEVMELMQPDAQHKDQTLALVGGDDHQATFMADEGSLRRALINLLRNAIQATPPKGRIELGAQKQDGRLMLSVQDDGPGVPEAEAEHIFDPFYTTKEKGLGLGLAFVQRIAQAHQGTASLAKSEKGARLVIDLPLE